MAKASTRTLLGAWLVLAGGCTPPDDEAALVAERFFAMGTWVEVSFVSPGPAVAASALADVEALLRTFERDFYPWTDGELAGLNSAIADGREATVSLELAELLRRAQEISVASGGLFEPGMGSLVELWGFHTTAASNDRQPPAATAIAATLEAGGTIGALEIDGLRVRSAARGLELDLGGIAKGAVVDRILVLLESHAIDSALVNAGGDLAVAGQPRADRPWRVGIRDPRSDGLLGILELADGEAAFTSGDYERFYDYGGRRLHHLLDPATGRPVEHTQALTVVSDDAALADAAATALFVAGPDRWRAVASRLGLDTVLRVDASGELELTDAMAARLEAAAMGHDLIMGSSHEARP